MLLRCPQCETEFMVGETDGNLPPATAREPSAVDSTQITNSATDKPSGELETVTYRVQDSTRLGRLELLEKVGAGAYGMVYKARDSELDRIVAVKIPHPGVWGSLNEENVFREARAAAQLKHPNVVSLHEIFRHGETVCLVNDYIEGISLAERLEAGRYGRKAAVQICQTIAEAIHHAHEKGVVHRDLKPSNILLDAKGEPHIVDFGLAKRDVGEVTMTEDGQILGTPAYMAPEQAEGDSHSADCRSDIYSLGVILFELLAGERPFRGNSRVLLYQVMNEEPPSPKRFDPEISKDLETIVLKCLEKNADDRFQSAQDLADELGRVLNGDPIHSRPISRLTRAWRWSRKNPSTAWLLISLFVLLPLTLVLLGALFFVNRERQVANVARIQAIQQKIEAEKQKDEAERQRGLALVAQKSAEEAEAEQRRLTEREAGLRREAEQQRAIAEEQRLLAEEQKKRVLYQEILAQIEAISAEEQAEFAEQQKLIAENALVAEEQARQAEAEQRILAERQRMLALEAAKQERKAKEEEAKQRELAEERSKTAQAWKIIAELNEMMIGSPDRAFLGGALPGD